MKPEDQAMQEALDGMKGSGPESQAWQAIRSDLQALRESAPECQVTFAHLEGRLYRESVRTSPMRTWLPALALGACVMGAAFFVGHRFGQESGPQVPIVAYNPPSEAPAGSRLRSEEDLFGADSTKPFTAPEIPLMAQNPGASAPQSGEVGAASEPAQAPRAAKAPAERPARRRPAAQAASLPAAAPAPAAAEKADAPAIAAAGFGGAEAPADAAAESVARAASFNSESESESEVVVVPAAPMGRAGAPIAIENPLMGDIIFGG